MDGQPKKYTVQDPKSGRTITFQWNSDTPPTDSDFENVFKQASLTSMPDSLRPKPMASDVTGTQTFANVHPQGAPLSNIIAPAVRLGVKVGTNSLGQNPMQTVSDIGSVGEVALPLLAAPLPPALRIPLSGALQGTGTALKLAGQGLPTGPMLRGAGESALMGMVGQGLGEIPIAALNKVSAPFAGAFDKPAAELAGKYGVDLPASALSKSGFVKATEALAAKGPFGVPLIQRVENAGQKLNQIADDMVSKFGTSTHPAEVGQSIADGLNKYETTFRNTKNQLYDAASLSKTQIPFNPEKTVPLLDRMIGELDNVAGKKPAILPELKAIRESLSGTNSAMIDRLKAQGYPDNVIQQVIDQLPQQSQTYVNTIKNTIQKLNNKINFKNPNPIVQGYEGQLKQLAATMSDDLDASIKAANPDLGAAIDKANAFYKEGITNLNSKWGQKITQFAQQGKLSELPSALLNKSTPSEWVGNIFNTVGPDATNSMRAATLEKIINDSRGGGTGFFTPQGLTKQIRQYGTDKLNAIFGSDATQKLQDLAQLSNAFGRGQQVAEGSQTGYILMALGALKGLTSAPVKALKMVVGDKLFTSFINSEAGQRLLTSGLSQIPQGVQAGAGNAIRVGGQSAINSQ